MSTSRNKVILVVTESESTAASITRILDGSGYNTSTTAATDTLPPSVSRSSPELIFLDMSLSTDHVALVRALHSKAPETPVVLLADKALAPAMVDVLKAGANDYLMLPVPDDSLLLFTVERCLKSRREQRKQRSAERELKQLNETLVDGLELLERDQQAGFRVQQGMMPATPFSSDHLTLRHHIVPSLILSGDFIDWFEVPDGRLVFYIADVSGHGASAAIVTVLLKSLSTRLANEMPELDLRDAGEILAWFNQELLACQLEQHATMFLGVLDSAGTSLQYANAAHFPATILSTQTETRELEIGGLPLGIYHTVTWPSRTVELPSSWTLVMFSDGVFEILPQESLKAKENELVSLVKSGAGDIDRLVDCLRLGELADVPDDIALFTVARSA